MVVREKPFLLKKQVDILLLKKVLMCIIKADLLNIKLDDITTFPDYDNSALRLCCLYVIICCIFMY